MPQTHVPQCHTHIFLEHLQGLRLQYLPGQPVPLPHHFSRELFPNIQSEIGWVLGHSRNRLLPLFSCAFWWPKKSLTVIVSLLLSELVWDRDSLNLQNIISAFFFSFFFSQSQANTNELVRYYSSFLKSPPLRSQICFSRNSKNYWAGIQMFYSDFQNQRWHVWRKFF